MKCRTYLIDVSIGCSLGNRKNDILNNLLFFKAPPFESDVPLFSGKIVSEMGLPFDLPKIPSHLEKFNSLNNRLITGMLHEMRESIDTVMNHYGKHRI